MYHSMIGADPGTHCKIVAVALAGAMTRTMVAIAARPGARDSAPAHPQSNAAVLKAGKSLQPRYTPMLKTMMIGAAVVAVIIASVLTYAATRPDRFQVQRSTSIKASADKIFPLINDLRSFNTWNPFEKKDPDIRGSYSGPQSGKGASYAFESTKAGTGSIAIVDTAPVSRVSMRLTMIKPLRADNRVQFFLEPERDGTRVTWAMDGEVPFVGKVIHLILSMDKMIGADFEAGLASLKAAAERSSSPSG
jgi:hypothetical protein